MAQDFLRQDDTSRGEKYNDHALEIFGHVVHQMPHTAKSVRDYTDALNGLGNIHYARRHYEAATNYYHLATTIDPLYCYSWHDLYGALYERARAGEEPDIAGMRQALDMTRLTGSGQPGLSADYLDGLHKRLNALETWTVGRGNARRPLRHTATPPPQRRVPARRASAGRLWRQPTRPSPPIPRIWMRNSSPARYSSSAAIQRRCPPTRRRCV